MALEGPLSLLGSSVCLCSPRSHRSINLFALPSFVKGSAHSCCRHIAISPDHLQRSSGDREGAVLFIAAAASGVTTASGVTAACHHRDCHDRTLRPHPYTTLGFRRHLRRRPRPTASGGGPPVAEGAGRRASHQTRPRRARGSPRHPEIIREEREAGSITHDARGGDDRHHARGMHEERACAVRGVLGGGAGGG